MKNNIIGIAFLAIGVVKCFCQPADSLQKAHQAYRNGLHDSLMTRHQAIREKALDDLKESIFRFRIDMGALDTVLQNLPIPHDIEISDKAIRIDIDGKNDDWKGFEIPKQKKEREDIVKFGEDVVINPDEQVNGDIVVIGGNIHVMGKVNRGIIVVFGNTHLSATSIVEDDVICIWGDTDIEDGAQIKGSTTVLQLGKAFTKDIDLGLFSSFIFAFRFFRFILLFTFLLLIYLAFPKPVENIRNQISAEYAKSMIIGLIGLVLLPVVFIILLITILGIPVALLILPLAVLLGFLFGGAGFSLYLGQRVQNVMGLKLTSFFLHLVIGMIILEFFPFLKKIMELIDPTLSMIFFIVTIIIFFLAWIPGFGAVLLTRFGTATQSQNKS